MMLTELTSVADAALPVATLKAHLRLGTGFGDDGMQDALLLSYLRAAIAVIEGRIGKVLIRRDFRLVLAHWRGADAQTLPLAPVTEVASVTLVDADGVAVVQDMARFRLLPDTHRPRLASRGSALPMIPTDGQVEVVFTAGFGPVWTDVPQDLAQAVLMLAAEYYEVRHEAGEGGGAGLPFGVVTLIERWRNVRVFGGGAS